MRWVVEINTHAQWEWVNWELTCVYGRRQWLAEECGACNALQPTSGINLAPPGRLLSRRMASELRKQKKSIGEARETAADCD